MSTEIRLDQVIEGLTTLIQDTKNELNIEASIDEETRPLKIIKSEVLVDIIGRLEDLLGVQIPANCYPFFDKEKCEELSIKQAAQIIMHKMKKDDR